MGLLRHNIPLGSVLRDLPGYLACAVRRVSRTGAYERLASGTVIHVHRVDNRRALAAPWMRPVRQVSNLGVRNAVQVSELSLFSLLPLIYF